MDAAAGLLALVEAEGIARATDAEVMDPASK